MVENSQTFRPFRRSPVELQLKIWKISANQSCRVFELFGREQTDDDVIIADITLYERIMRFHRPLLEVDRSSRLENLRHYRLVKFLNAHIYFNLEIDIIFFGPFHEENLDPLFLQLETSPQESFWREIKHMAFGIAEVKRLLNLDMSDFYASVDKHCWGLRKLQQSPFLETFSVVLDALESGHRWPPRKNGIITLGPAEAALCNSSAPKEELDAWTPFFLQSNTTKLGPFIPSGICLSFCSSPFLGAGGSSTLIQMDMTLI